MMFVYIRQMDEQELNISYVGLGLWLWDLDCARVCLIAGYAQ